MTGGTTSCPIQTYSVLILLCLHALTAPEDPAILVEADGQECSRKGLKTIQFPLLDADALESSIAVRVMGCIGKWQLKLRNMVNPMEASPVDADKEAQDREAKTDSLTRLPS